MKSLIFLLTLISVNFASADVSSVIPAGYELAKTYAELGDYPDAEAPKGSVIKYDFNKDGLLDLALLVEKRTCGGEMINGDCVADYWGWGAEDRKLLVYFNTKTGYKLFLDTQNGILNDGEGGVASRDPLMSFEVNKKGSIVLSYWGGSSTKWGFDFKFQYRTVKGVSDFYVVGITQMGQGWVENSAGEFVDMETVTVDHNLITGDVITTSFLMSDENSDKVTRSKDKKPLVKVRDAVDMLGW